MQKIAPMLSNQKNHHPLSLENRNNLDLLEEKKDFIFFKEDFMIPLACETSQLNSIFF